MSRVAASVAKDKRERPGLYCPLCLWLTGGGPCPRHGGPAWTPERQAAANAEAIRDYRGEEEPAELDPTKYRVNLLCSCDADLVFAYGPTIEIARAAAVKIFRRQHGSRASWKEETVEQAVETKNGSSHYELVTP